MSTQQIRVFLGDSISDPSEGRFLRRLRSDLASRVPWACIFANFTADARNAARQIDFLVLTPYRLAHVELKTLDANRPILGPANGPWRQALPGGGVKEWSGNAHQQALRGTYAISDDVHRLMNAGRLAKRPGKFATMIDTVLCLANGIPPGSSIDRRRHVTVWGYQDLLNGLVKAGPHPGWSQHDGQAFARALNLYAEPADAQASDRRRVDLNVLAEYRGRFLESMERDLHELIPIAASGDGSDVLTRPLDAVLEAVHSCQAMVIVGPSGMGKTHLVSHAAERATQDGLLMIWVRCEDYPQEDFAVVMAKAVAPFTPEPWRNLIQRANDNGVTPVLILDGLNRCSPAQQRALLDGAGSFRLATPCALIVTSQQPTPVLDGTTMTLQEPSPAERDSLLESYGASQLPYADLFRTPMELALAAECAADLTADAQPIHVFDLYVRRCTESEAQRDHLRALARSMHERLSFSMPLAHARSVIGELTEGLPTGQQFEDLLDCRLFRVGPQRLGFTHELFDRFLAAQHLALNARSGQETASALNEPALADLWPMVLPLTPDGARRAKTLLALGNPQLLADAAQGLLGPATEQRVIAALRDALERAQSLTAAARFHYDQVLAAVTDEERAQLDTIGWCLPNGPLDMRFRLHGSDEQHTGWVVNTVTAEDRALLTACGLCLHDGLLVPETISLLDVTDEHSAAVMAALADNEVEDPLMVVAATYPTPSVFQFYDAGTFTFRWADEPATELPATMLLRGATLHGIKKRFQAIDVPKDLQQQESAVQVLPAATEQSRWGFLAAAIFTVNTHSTQDLALAPRLVNAAWHIGTFEFQTAALELAQVAASALDATDKHALADVAKQIAHDLANRDDPSPFLNSALMDVLGKCGAFKPSTSEASILAEITELLTSPTDPAACRRAAAIIGAQFEPPILDNPCTRVIEGLEPANLIRLCAMGVRGDAALSEDETRADFITDWAITQIADHIDAADADVTDVVKNAISVPPAATASSHEGVIAHLEALRGWAQITDHLAPAPATSGDLAARSWRLIDELILALFREETLPEGRAEAIWVDLGDLCAPTAVDALSHLHNVSSGSWSSPSTSLHTQLIDRYPDEIRTLLQWGLFNWELVKPAIGHSLHTTRGHLVRELGELGDRETARLLNRYINDPIVAADAIHAIRTIERRLG